MIFSYYLSLSETVIPIRIYCSISCFPYHEADLSVFPMGGRYLSVIKKLMDSISTSVYIIQQISIEIEDEEYINP